MLLYIITMPVQRGLARSPALVLAGGLVLAFVVQRAHTRADGCATLWQSNSSPVQLLALFGGLFLWLWYSVQTPCELKGPVTACCCCCPLLAAAPAGATEFAQRPGQQQQQVSNRHVC